MNVNDYIGLDFETYGATDLPKFGLDRYTSCSTFQPLIASLATMRAAGRSAASWNVHTDTLPLWDSSPAMIEALKRNIGERYIVAHNAGFEQRVLNELGLIYPSEQFIDSAAVARAMGAAGKLEAAAPQLLGVDKLEDGKRLIRLFSIPNVAYQGGGNHAFDPRVIADHPDDWLLFIKYCELDAELGLRIWKYGREFYSVAEVQNQAITMDMNLTGWPVDMATVEEMQRRYLDNQAAALEQFRGSHVDAAELNLNSLKQLKEFCSDRGIKASSFDEKHVARLLKRIDAKLDTMDEWHVKYQDYLEVRHMLMTKQILGGSSLKKLAVLLDTTGKDCRLRDQYLHIGAGQTWRTTGRSVQMQNLKRLDSDNIGDMAELQDLDVIWDNDKLAQNMRQSFTSSQVDGQLIVGDFSSVEARGLAWLAGDVAKLDAYRQGKDMYKVLAAEMYGVRYEDVTKTQRQGGKVGVLSCGYQAGGGAVQAFAAGMGIEMTEAEASKLVSDWRAANPQVVNLWATLDELLHEVVENGAQIARAPVGDMGKYTVTVYETTTPASLWDMHKHARSIAVEMKKPNGDIILTRFFHGCYMRGNSICYYKPSELKSGDVWKNHFTDPKTKQVRFYSIYGGKLAGILTQSFCRELFFASLRKVHAWCKGHGNLDLIGQFHDEIVLDWWPAPAAINLDQAMGGLATLMSDAGDITGFPLEADIKHDYRYTK